MDVFNIVAWNMRGYNHPLKRKDFKKLVANLNICCGAILETRVRQLNMEDLITYWDKSFWKTFDNCSLDKNCKNFLFRDFTRVHLQVEDSSDQYIHCSFESIS